MNIHLMHELSSNHAKVQLKFIGYMILIKFIVVGIINNWLYESIHYNSFQKIK